MIAVQPGKANTLGISAGVFNSVRPAEPGGRPGAGTGTLRAALGSRRLRRRLGGSPGRERRVTVIAVGPRFDQIFKFSPSHGTFLPDDDLERPRPVVVLGARVHEELFGGENPLNDRVRVGGNRYRVIGVMEPKGDMLGIDLDDTVFIPVASGLALFNREGVHEIDVLYDENASVDEVIAATERILIARHGGEDFTIVSQQQMLDVLGSIIGVLTLGVAAIGSISLLVGGVGIFTIMTIAVRERTAEIGLLRAVGAERRRISQLFLGRGDAARRPGRYRGPGGRHRRDCRRGFRGSRHADPDRPALCGTRGNRRCRDRLDRRGLARAPRRRAGTSQGAERRVKCRVDTK